MGQALASADTIIRVWKDEEDEAALNSIVRSRIPANPAGVIDINHLLPARRNKDDEIRANSYGTCDSYGTCNSYGTCDSYGTCNSYGTCDSYGTCNSYGTCATVSGQCD